MIDLEKLPQHLETISREDWEKLFSLSDEINQTTNFGELLEGRQLADGSITSPYWISSKVVDKFFDAVYDLGIVVSFDWPRWKEGIDILKNPDKDYIQLDTITLCKLITTIVRADRFNQGYLSGCFEAGIIQKIIYALRLKVIK